MLQSNQRPGQNNMNYWGWPLVAPATVVQYVCRVLLYWTRTGHSLIEAGIGRGYGRHPRLVKGAHRRHPRRVPLEAACRGLVSTGVSSTRHKNELFLGPCFKGIWVVD